MPGEREPYVNSVSSAIDDAEILVEGQCGLSSSGVYCSWDARVRLLAIGRGGLRRLLPYRAVWEHGGIANPDISKSG